jgi:hypothetical protein
MNGSNYDWEILYNPTSPFKELSMQEAKKPKDAPLFFEPTGGEECKSVAFAAGIQVGNEVITGLNADHPHHKEKVEGKILYYRGVEVRFTYKGVKKAVPVGALKDVTLA